MSFGRGISIALLAGLLASGTALAQESGGGGEKGSGEGGSQNAAGQAGGAHETPPPAVTVATVEGRTIPITYEYAARVAASREVEVRARVAGIILQRTFEEGSRVAQNQVLFRIDPREYQAAVEQAKATVQQAEAQLTNARRTEERQRSLVQSGATSTATLDDAVANRQLAEAQLASANAQLYTANLSLTYATVNAPVGGITSLEQVPEGSLVSVNDLLTRISQLDPIYVNFSASDTEAVQIRRLIESGAAYGAGTGLSAEVIFGDGSTYNKTGTIDFTSSTIDTNTGTISSRAVFENGEQRLLPGQFVRISIKGLSLENGIEVPATALMQNPQGQFVFTLDQNNVAQVRPITVGRELNERIIVSSGLKSGDRIVTEGVVKVRPGAPVNPTGAQPDAAGSAGSAQTGNAQPAPGQARATNAGAPSGTGGAQGANQPTGQGDAAPTPAGDSATGNQLGSGVQARGEAQGQGGGPVDNTPSGANNDNVKAGQAGSAGAGQ
ncbi:efflux RND transporter periplasmic adaptor subunit [Aureimonas psammosilenae]|uniref:efflux RND transporter periplasmic adaptor subunit n=1 Tax=Aureimonas psammosilenae TaxID=2495496 RepID=UPI00126137E2|nr:efflux RND transporter periplasmic adaptor subunit [Aureimonas psammosilenae]